jgi:4-hydroxy-2-oxoglutarate aldolase
MDTDLILRLAVHPNIAGIKHTDHDVGKIARESAALKGLQSAWSEPS